MIVENGYSTSAVGSVPLNGHRESSTQFLSAHAQRRTVVETHINQLLTHKNQKVIVFRVDRYFTYMASKFLNSLIMIIRMMKEKLLKFKYFPLCTNRR